MGHRPPIGSSRQEISLAFKLGDAGHAKVAEREGPIAAHGASGPGHACLAVSAPAEYEGWKRHLASRGVEITHEHAWGDERRSFYLLTDPIGRRLLSTAPP